MRIKDGDLEHEGDENLLFRHQSPFQLIEMWDNLNSTYTLTLDGCTQFISGDEDEAVYHKALAGDPARMLSKPTKALILGGGDGLAARDLLKCPLVVSITLVEIDPAMINLARNHRLLKVVNEDSMSDPKVTSIASDAEEFLSTTPEKFGLAILDFPDPIYPQHKKLYSLPFYQKLAGVLDTDPVVSVQASGGTGPVKALVANNLEKVTQAKPYIAYHRTVSLGDGSTVYGGSGVNPAMIPSWGTLYNKEKSTGLF